MYVCGRCLLYWITCISSIKNHSYNRERHFDIRPFKSDCCDTLSFHQCTCGRLRTLLRSWDDSILPPAAPPSGPPSVWISSPRSLSTCHPGTLIGAPFSSLARLSRQHRGCAPRLNDKRKSKQAPQRPPPSPRRPAGPDINHQWALWGKKLNGMKSKRQKKRGGDGHGEASGDNSKIVIRWRSLCPGCCNVGAGSLFTRASVRQGCADCLCMTLNHSRRRHQTFMGTFFKLF